MLFVQHDETFLLIDETAPPEANVIATVRGPVELLALKGLCEVRLGAGDCMQPFNFTFDDCQYQVTPFTDRGNQLSLRIQGSDGSVSRVETAFVTPAD